MGLVVMVLLLVLWLLLVVVIIGHHHRQSVDCDGWVVTPAAAAATAVAAVEGVLHCSVVVVVTDEASDRHESEELRTQSGRTRQTAASACVRMRVRPFAVRLASPAPSLSWLLAPSSVVSLVRSTAAVAG